MCPFHSSLVFKSLCDLHQVWHHLKEHLCVETSDEHKEVNFSQLTITTNIEYVVSEIINEGVRSFLQNLHNFVEMVLSPLDAEVKALSNLFTELFIVLSHEIVLEMGSAHLKYTPATA